MTDSRIPENRIQYPGRRYWEMKTALCEIMDLVNEVIPTDVSDDEQYKFPSENALKRVTELRKHYNELRKCLCQLYASMDKAADYLVDCDGSTETMWDYDIEQAQNDIGVALYGNKYSGKFDDVLDKVKEELSNDH